MTKVYRNSLLHKLLQYIYIYILLYFNKYYRISRTVTCSFQKHLHHLKAHLFNNLKFHIMPSHNPPEAMKPKGHWRQASGRVSSNHRYLHVVLNTSMPRWSWNPPRPPRWGPHRLDTPGFLGDIGKQTRRLPRAVLEMNPRFGECILYIYNEYIIYMNIMGIGFPHSLQFAAGGVLIRWPSKTFMSFQVSLIMLIAKPWSCTVTSNCIFQLPCFSVK